MLTAAPLLVAALPCVSLSAHGGASFRALVGRARAFLDRLAGRPEDSLIAVFTHGLFTKAVMWSLLTGVTDPDATAMRVVGGGTTHLAHLD